MARQPRALIAGNWKMNGLAKPAAREAKKMVTRAVRARPLGADVLLCPPFTLLPVLRDVLRGSRIALGGQDCHAEAEGAHTGDIAAEMLADAGATLVILGHSERRADHGETNAMVRAKAEAAARAGSHVAARFSTLALSDAIFTIATTPRKRSARSAAPSESRKHAASTSR